MIYVYFFSEYTEYKYVDNKNTDRKISVSASEPSCSIYIRLTN